MPVAPGGPLAQPLPPPDSGTPVADLSAADAPAASDAPSADESVAEEPVADEPAAAAPTASEPTADVPAVNVPATDVNRVTLTTRPDGASEVPPTSSDAKARIDLMYDTNTRLLRWIAEWTGLSSPITDVRFYGPASPGQQGQPALIWPEPFGPRYEGRATLTPQQATDLMGGLWYVSINTMNYPGGEIRGQLRVVY